MEELASLEEVAGRCRLRFVRHLHHPPEKVWRALTEPEHLAAWFPCDIEGERQPGASLKFVFRNNEGPDIGGEMVRYEPYELLELTWGADVLRFELATEGDGCVLTFSDTFDELGKAARDAAGWEICLQLFGRDLRGEATGGGPNPGPTPDWQSYRDRYVERFGPEAGTIGPPA